MTWNMDVPNDGNKILYHTKTFCFKLHNHIYLYSTFGGQKQPWYVWWHQMRDHHYIDLSFHSNHCSRFCTTTKYYSQFFAPFIYSVKWRSIFYPNETDMSNQFQRNLFLCSLPAKLDKFTWKHINSKLKLR